MPRTKHTTHVAVPTTEWCQLVASCPEGYELASLYFVPDQLVTPDVIKLLGEPSESCATKFLLVVQEDMTIEGFEAFEKFRGNLVTIEQDPCEVRAYSTPGPVVRFVTLDAYCP